MWLEHGGVSLSHCCSSRLCLQGEEGGGADIKRQILHHHLHLWRLFRRTGAEDAKKSAFITGDDSLHPPILQRESDRERDRRRETDRGGARRRERGGDETDRGGERGDRQRGGDRQTGGPPPAAGLFLLFYTETLCLLMNGSDDVILGALFMIVEPDADWCHALTAALISERERERGGGEWERERERERTVLVQHNDALIKFTYYWSVDNL